eukprot:242816_1
MSESEREETKQEVPTDETAHSNQNQQVACNANHSDRSDCDKNDHNPDMLKEDYLRFMQEKDYHNAMTCAYKLTECHDPAAHMFVAHTLFIYHIQSPAKEIDYKEMDVVTKVQQLLNTDEKETKIDDEVRRLYSEMINEYTESNKSGDDTRCCRCTCCILPKSPSLVLIEDCTNEITRLEAELCHVSEPHELMAGIELSDMTRNNETKHSQKDTKLRLKLKYDERYELHMNYGPYSYEDAINDAKRLIELGDENGKGKQVNAVTQQLMYLSILWIAPLRSKREE